MAVDYGTDVSTYRDGDLDPTFTIISGRRVISEAVARRLETPRGTCLRDPNYGSDTRGWLNRDFVAAEKTLFRLKALIEAEAEKDERVLGAEASIAYDPAIQKLRVVIMLEAAGGPFQLVLDITQVSVAIIEPE